MKILETERLNLCEVTLKDAPFILELLNTPGWLKYIGDRGVRTLEDAEKYIQEKIRNCYPKDGFGMYAVQDKKSGETLGTCGLINREGLDGVDIGFGFLPQYGGKGYAYESAAAVMNFAKTTLGLKKVVAITLPENARSINLLKRIGLNFEKEIYLPGDPEELMLFSIVFGE